MNKAELVTQIAHATGHNKVQVQSALAATLHVITGALSRGERITLIGFGTFERRQRQARVGVNPQDPKQKLRIAAARVPAFRAGQELKDIVDGRAKLPNLEISRHEPKHAAKAAKGGKKKSGGKKSKKRR
ncbi:MAG: DNA-binding protein [Candidatus Melainabacteria bacterium]|nr:MAG: DNA-binding protein [Candidatus Melainabacteria bacterium]